MPRQRQPRADERPDGPGTDDQYAQSSLESANGERDEKTNARMTKSALTE